MNRDEFFKQLEQQLRRLPKDEAQEALEYYREYVDEAGPENEEKVISELGSPAKIVTQLKAESAIRQLRVEEKPTVKKGISAIWWVILAICAAPIALPLAVAAVAVIVALAIAALAIVAALVITVVAFFGSGIVVLIIGFSILASSIPVGIFNIGAGMIILGVTLLLGILVVLVTRAFVYGIARLTQRRRPERAAKKRSKGILEKEEPRDE